MFFILFSFAIMKLENWCLTGEEHDHPQDTVISKLFEDLLEKNLDLQNKVALIHAETKAELTFRELNEKANALARLILRKIKKEGMLPNQDGDYIVGLRFVPDESLVITILALFKAGLAYVPLAPNWPEGRVQHIINEAQPIMLMTNAKSDILVKAQKELSITKKRPIFQYKEMIEEAFKTNTSILNLPSNQILNNSLKGSRLYSVLYTSGSTGTPKGVRHVHRAACNRFFWQWRCFPYSKDEVCVFKTTLTFVDSVTEIWSPLLSGKKVVIFPTKVTQNVEDFVNKLEEFKIGRVFVVTSLVRNILAFCRLNKQKKRLQFVKIWDCSAEPVTKEILLSFFDYFPQDHMISNFYGSTEIMDVTYETFKSKENVLDVSMDDKIPIGYPVDNTKAYIFDDNLQPVNEGNIGNLYIASRNLGAGYVGAKEGGFLTNPHCEAMDDYKILYKTGDFAINKNSRLYFEGRADSQVKIRGHRVDLSEIEKALTDVISVTKATVLCFSPGMPNQKVLCFYTVKEGFVMPEPKLEVLLSSVLPDYMMPKLIKLNSFPLLVNGKIDRQVLLKKYEDSLSCSHFEFGEEDLKEIEESDHTMAKVLLSSVASVIQNPNHKPTLEDNFFSIGGDSLNMVMVIGKISDHGYNISVTNFVMSAKLKDVIKHLTAGEIQDDLDHVLKKMREENEYSSGDLKEEHKAIVLDMVSRSFAEKGDLTTLATVTYEVLIEQLEVLWPSLLAANLSIVVYNKKNIPIAACLNFDARSSEAAPLCARAAFSRNMNDSEQSAGKNGEEVDTPELPEAVDEVPMSVVEFLESVEEPLKEKHIPKEMGKFIYTSMLGTAKNLRYEFQFPLKKAFYSSFFFSPLENIRVALFMEQENIRKGRERGFLGIFTANANRLTQLISRTLKYQVKV